MSKKKTKTIGILGGMGPEATARFFELIIKNTAARKDQDHLKIIVFNYPQIPDRTRAILHGGENPVPFLLEGLKILERAGAELCAIPCMTAHYFFPWLRGKTKLKLIHLINETAGYIRRTHPEIKKAGLLATRGTMATGIFHRALKKKGLETICPSEEELDLVMEAIYGSEGIKAGFTRGRPRKLLLQVARRLISRGAEAIIAGCTEIPLVLKEKEPDILFLDPMLIGARVLIEKAGGELREPHFLTNSR